MPGAQAEEPAPLAPNERAERLFDENYPAELRDAVQRALQRGRDWLLRQQAADGTFPARGRGQGGYPLGVSALATLTLLHCGLKGDDARIERAFAAMRPLAMQDTYSVSVLLMALDARYEPATDPFVVEETDRYGNRKDSEPCARAITAADLAWMKQGVAFLIDNQNADGVWRYPSGGYDLSNTQFALLGLHAASRCGVTVPQQVWLSALREVLEQQEKTGEAVEYKANEVRGRYRFEWTERALARGFRYTPETQAVTGSMTTAGLTALFICQSRLWRARAYSGQLRLDTERGIRDAKAWLQQHFTVTENPGLGHVWHYYYLYGVERAGVIGRFRNLGTTDWYLEGARLLLQDQRNDGAFPGGLVDTCFALLFLKRASVRVGAPPTVVTPRAEGQAPPEAAPVADEPQPLSLGEQADQLLLLARWVKALEDPDPDTAFGAALALGRLRDRRAVDALSRALARHPDTEVRVAAAEALGQLRASEAFGALVDALQDAEIVVRAAADAALRRLSGHQEFAPVIAEDRNGRARLQRDWRTWFKENETPMRRRLGQAPLDGS